LHWEWISEYPYVGRVRWTFLRPPTVDAGLEPLGGVDVTQLPAVGPFIFSTMRSNLLSSCVFPSWMQTDMRVSRRDASAAIAAAIASASAGAPTRDREDKKMMELVEEETVKRALAGRGAATQRGRRWRVTRTSADGDVVGRSSMEHDASSALEITPDGVDMSRRLNERLAAAVARAAVAGGASGGVGALPADARASATDMTTGSHAATSLPSAAIRPSSLRPARVVVGDLVTRPLGGAAEVSVSTLNVDENGVAAIDKTRGNTHYAVRSISAPKVPTRNSSLPLSVGNRLLRLGGRASRFFRGHYGTGPTLLGLEPATGVDAPLVEVSDEQTARVRRSIPPTTRVTYTLDRSGRLVPARRGAFWWNQSIREP